MNPLHIVRKTRPMLYMATFFFLFLHDKRQNWNVGILMFHSSHDEITTYLIHLFKDNAFKLGRCFNPSLEINLPNAYPLVHGDAFLLDGTRCNQ